MWFNCIQDDLIHNHDMVYDVTLIKKLYGRFVEPTEVYYRIGDLEEEKAELTKEVGSCVTG